MISWYDLAVAGREAHLEWLHGTYIPKMLRRPGVLWAAHYASEKLTLPPRIRTTTEPVPAGNDFILLFGGASSHAFTRDAASFAEGKPSAFYASLTDSDRKMLSARVSVLPMKAPVKVPLPSGNGVAGVESSRKYE